MYNAPKTHFVASFIGSPSMNFIPCQVVKTNEDLNIKINDKLYFSVPKDRLDRYKVLINKEAILGIRPEHLTNAKQHIHDMYEDFNAKVKVLEPMGMDTMVFFDISEAEVCARCDPKSVGKVQSDMTFTIDKSQIHLIDIKTNKVI